MKGGRPYSSGGALLIGRFQTVDGIVVGGELGKIGRPLVRHCSALVVDLD